MVEKGMIHLKDLYHLLRNSHISIDKEFLKNLMILASKNERPHCDMKFIRALNMKSTTRYTCCTIYGWTKNKTIPLSKLAKIIEIAKVDWEEVEKKLLSIKIGQHGGEIKPRFPIKIDGNLGSIIGHILGDGSIDLRYQQVFFSNSDKILLKEFEKSMWKLFGIKPRIWMQKEPYFGNTKWDKKLNSIEDLKEGRNCGLFYPSGCGLILNFIFNDFARGGNKKITKKIKLANRDFKAKLIRAFYDDEGSVDVKSNYIRLFQNRKEMLEEFRSLLIGFGINAGEIRSYLRNNKKQYYFSVYRKGNFILFKENIGLTSSKKAARLEELTR